LYDAVPENALLSGARIIDVKTAAISIAVHVV
jgi:hypothetical protein